MNDNVVALPFSSIPTEEPVQRVIDILKDTLSRAQDGQVIAIAIVTVERQPLANVFEYVAEQRSRHSLMAGVLGLAHRVGAEACKGDD